MTDIAIKPEQAQAEEPAGVESVLYMPSERLDDFTLEELQHEASAWQRYNFPATAERGALHPLMGVCEEVGELVEAWLTTQGQDLDRETKALLGCQVMLGRMMHATLKTAQGIRDDAKTHQLAFDMNSVRLGNLARFLAPEELTQASRHEDRRLLADQVDHHLSTLKRKEDSGIADSAADLVIYLVNFMELASHKLHHAVVETWKSVRRRDWRKFPKNGRTE